MTAQKKSGWDKIDILLRPVGGMLTALSVALVGFLGSQYLEERQMEETNVRLYAELMSSREEADSALRKDMFNMAIGTLLANEPEDIEKLLLELELLAFNFHDAIDLAPLFQHLQRKIDGSEREKDLAMERRARLVRVAREIIDKQVAVLEDAGAEVFTSFDPRIFDQGVSPCLVETDFDTILRLSSEEDPGVCEDAAGPGANDGPPNTEQNRYLFRVEALDVDPITTEVLVRLRVATTEDPANAFVDVHFDVGFFDFPLIDNTRLPRLDGVAADDRAAVVLRKFEPYQVALSLVYFPGSRSSLKEKPFYDQIVDQLMDTRLQMREQQ